MADSKWNLVSLLGTGGKIPKGFKRDAASVVSSGSITLTIGEHDLTEVQSVTPELLSAGGCSNPENVRFEKTVSGSTATLSVFGGDAAIALDIILRNY